MQRNVILCLLAFSCAFEALGQVIPQNPNSIDTKGQRQGTWTILFDAEWRTTTSADSAAYYRVISYRDDKPQDTVRDFYLDGTVQFEGRLLEDRPQEVLDGEVTWYRTDGSRESTAIFEKGELREQTWFNLDGTVAEPPWTVLNEQGVVQFNEGAYANALEIFERAFEQARREFREDHPNFLLALSSLAICYYYDAQYDKAIDIFRQLIDVNERVFGRRSIRYAEGLTNLGGVLYTLGRTDEALPLYLEALATREAIEGRNEEYAYTLMEIGTVYRALGDYVEAEKALVEAIELTEATIGKENTYYPKIITAAGALYDVTGDFRRAEELYREALAITERVKGKDHPDYSTILNNLAILQDYLGNFELARTLYEEALSIAGQTYGTDHPEYSHYLNNLGAVYYALNDTAKAEELYLQSLAIVERSLGKETSDYATRLVNLGGVYANMGLFEKAERVFVEALAIRERVVGKEHVDYAMALHVLGRLYIDMEEFEKARPRLTEALALRERLLGTHHPDYGLSLREMGLLATGMENYEEAERYFERANDQLLEQVRVHFIGLSDKEKSHFYAERIAPQFEYFNNFALMRLPENKRITERLYDNQLATKALLFHTANKLRRRILATDDDSLKNIYDQWVHRRTELSRAFQLTEAQRQAESIDLNALEASVNTLEKALSARSSLFASAAENRRYKWTEVRDKLKRGEAAIEIIRFRIHDGHWTDTVRYAALIVTARSTVPKYVLLGNGYDMEHRYLTYYRNTIRQQLEDQYSWNVFWQPIADALKEEGKIKRVYISPDGVYNIMNLKTFREPNSGRYLGDEVDIRMVTNTSDLVRPRPERKELRNAVFFGYPQYDFTREVLESDGDRGTTPGSEGHAARGLFAQGKIGMLPGTRAEVNAVSGMMDRGSVPTTVFMHESASEEALRSVDSPDVLHIATHGFFMEDWDITAQPGSAASRMAENPLLRSGLLLAGAQHTFDGHFAGSEHDGILTAYEAMSMNLDSTQLVVLSACETGLGEIRNGEGVYGLQRAFQTAGAETVLMSLWKVDDQATQALMVEFYKYWLKVKDKAEALSLAQKAIKVKYPHPFYWGAFVLVGE